jgi:hypothetical protein
MLVIMTRAQVPCFLNGNRGFAFQNEQAARYSILGADPWNLGIDQKNRLHPHERKLKKIPPLSFDVPSQSQRTRARRSTTAAVRGGTRYLP